jgi:hypothetical protein
MRCEREGGERGAHRERGDRPFRIEYGHGRVLLEVLSESSNAICAQIRRGFCSIERKCTIGPLGDLVKDSRA